MRKRRPKNSTIAKGLGYALIVLTALLMALQLVARIDLSTAQAFTFLLSLLAFMYAWVEGLSIRISNLQSELAKSVRINEAYKAEVGYVGNDFVKGQKSIVLRQVSDQDNQTDLYCGALSASMMRKAAADAGYELSPKRTT